MRKTVEVHANPPPGEAHFLVVPLMRSSCALRHLLGRNQRCPVIRIADKRRRPPNGAPQIAPNYRGDLSGSAKCPEAGIDNVAGLRARRGQRAAAPNSKRYAVTQDLSERCQQRRGPTAGHLAGQRPYRRICSRTSRAGQTLPCCGDGLAQCAGRRRRNSSKKLSRIVAWTVVGSALLFSGEASTKKRRPSGAMSRFQSAL